ncbi:MAG: Formate hydrogenlyase subunit 5 precursor [Verrucomicrobia bacterium ADurb.Bin345]|nr:MAG: Formate hydrogenlyase subunit 5 precursor [Verrucomicrobia bacterium ADurb.Bin345]
MNTTLRNPEAIRLADIPLLDIATFRNRILTAVAEGGRVNALFCHEQEDQAHQLFALLAHPGQNTLEGIAARIGGEYPALTPECPQVHLFEREMAESGGVTPVGHPWLKPVRFPARAGGPPVGHMDFYRVDGDEVHEVAVGPVHAGIIEPGHFRFQCHGETVLHLEISLGYQHRGVERALIGGPDIRTLHYMETLAGDTTIGHTTAYCQLAEALGGIRVPLRAEALRAVALELERLANHTGDLGALAADIGFLPTSAYCGRIRGDFLNMSALLCGSRFSRGLVRPGGVAFDLEPVRRAELQKRLLAAQRDVTGAVTLLWSNPSVLARFEDTGRLSATQCRELGLVGPATRAAGVDQDVRADLPHGFYRFFQIPAAAMTSGDVFGRAYVRWLEIQRSIEFILNTLSALPGGDVTAHPKTLKLQPEALAVSLVEGWRGEICHVALTGPNGRFTRYKVFDASFHNWLGLALAMRAGQISDFPLCNKSFNLSYCGFDL